MLVISICHYIVSIIITKEYIYLIIYTFIELPEDLYDGRTGATKRNNTKDKTYLKNGRYLAFHS